MGYIVAAILVIGLFALNVYLYRENQKTPVPPGCENLTPDCEACGIKSCSVRKQSKEEA